MLQQGQEFFRQWGSYVVGAAVMVILVIAFVAYRSKATEQETADAWKSLGEIQRRSFLTQSGEKRTDAEIRMGFEGMQKVADQAQDSDLVFEALSRQALIAMRLSTMGERGADPVYLDRAEQVLNALKERLPDNALAVASALHGLAAIEADRFVVDGDSSRKERARKVLEQLRDDPRFANTPFQTSALDRLNRLDEVFSKVEFAPAPEPVALTPFEGPPVPPTGASPAEGEVKLKRVPAPAPAEAPADADPESEETAEPSPLPPSDAAEPNADEPGSD